MLRAFAQLVGAVVALDVMAIAIYKVAGIEQRGGQVLQSYVVVWTLASALAAAWGLWKVKQARNAMRRDRMAGTGRSGAPRDD